MEWIVSCDRCGNFSTYQKGEPLSCPLCGEADINTEPADGERPQEETVEEENFDFVSDDGIVMVTLENLGEGLDGDCFDVDR